MFVEFGGWTGADVYTKKEEILWREHEVCELLFKLEKSSLNCEIVFMGYYITASSKGRLQNDSIDCQHRCLNTSVE